MTDKRLDHFNYVLDDHWYMKFCKNNSTVHLEKRQRPMKYGEVMRKNVIKVKKKCRSLMKNIH